MPEKLTLPPSRSSTNPVGGNLSGSKDIYQQIRNQAPKKFTKRDITKRDIYSDFARSFGTGKVTRVQSSVLWKKGERGLKEEMRAFSKKPSGQNLSGNDIDIISKGIGDILKKKLTGRTYVKQKEHLTSADLTELHQNLKKALEHGKISETDAGNAMQMAKHIEI
ncbi:MAG: hypothetical protein ABH896_00485 [Candidatus Jacksonbacteria bacterium]